MRPAILGAMAESSPFNAAGELDEVSGDGGFVEPEFPDAKGYDGDEEEGDESFHEVLSETARTPAREKSVM